METREDIYQTLSDILESVFEVNRADISPEVNLYEDLDIDSIDAVDLIIELQELTGKKVDPDEFKAVRSVNDVVNAIAGLLGVE